MDFKILNVFSGTRAANPSGAPDSPPSPPPDETESKQRVDTKCI